MAVAAFLRMAIEHLHDRFLVPNLRFLVPNLSAKSCLALSKPMAFFHLFLFPEKGGRGQRTGEDDLASDTSLVHLQLQVRGGVSLGQYYSTVRAIHSPRVYIKIIISLWMQSS
jgi:hypothetical protein